MQCLVDKEIAEAEYINGSTAIVRIG